MHLCAALITQTSLSADRLFSAQASLSMSSSKIAHSWAHWTASFVLISAGLFAPSLSLAVDKAGSEIERIPCWGDPDRTSLISTTFPHFSQSVRAITCQPRLSPPKSSPPSLATHSQISHKPSAPEFVRTRRGTNTEPGIDHALAIGWNGKPVRPRKSARMVHYTTKDNETIRSVAYRVASSPTAIAEANGLDWDPEGVPLPPGLKLKVPLRFAPATGFARAVRLTTGPGVLAQRSNTSWGRPYVVRGLRDAFQAMHRRWPNRHPILAHDISRLGGGRLSPHKSHRGGRDIDLGYPTTEPNRERWGRPSLDEIDYERLWFVIDRMERQGILSAIYMAPRIQRQLYHYALNQAGAERSRLAPMFQYPAAKGARKTLIRYSPGHRNHMHIRFESPKELARIAIPVPQT